MHTFDQYTIDSTGNFLIGQLEKLDPKLNKPLMTFTWSRDIDLREDITIANDTASFLLAGYAETGGMSPNGISWISQGTDSISGVAVDVGKTPQPLHLWGKELKWTVVDLAKSQALGEGIDVTYYDVMQKAYNQNVDQVVYTGDTLKGFTGLCNSSYVSNVANVPTAGSTSPTSNTTSTKWADKTPVAILADVNETLNSAWQASAWSVFPNRLLLPPGSMSYLTSTIISVNGQAGGMSLLRFIRENNIANEQGQDLQILPLKWLNGRGTGGTAGDATTVNRMVAYHKSPDYVRYPLTDLQRTPLEYRSIYQAVTYYGRLGQMEFIYPETFAYRDGI
ncbi:DUF2184 domain-containing protein [Methylobacterium sp. 1973]|uniref:DUF2184 domain-containing protein n=1 Tax=Methylobacterium sp. 1973 TaxID=3156421 RepID=UPI003394BC04